MKIEMRKVMGRKASKITASQLKNQTRLCHNQTPPCVVANRQNQANAFVAYITMCLSAHIDVESKGNPW